MSTKKILVMASAAAMAIIPAGAAGAAAPDEQGKGVELSEPGVVLVITEATIEVRMDAPDASSATGKSVFRGSYSTTVGTGSGFVVTPDGGIVTASHVVDVEEDESLRVWAANQLFFVDPQTRAEEYVLQPDEDPWTRFSLDDDAFLDEWLQACYDGDICTFEIEPTVSVVTGVEIAGTQQPKGLPAQVRESTGYDDTDVAVLQVAGQNMPTVPLAETAGTLNNNDPIIALGFPGSHLQLPTGLTEPNNDDGNISAIQVINGTRQIAVNNLSAEGGMSGGPAIGADGKVIGLVSWGLLRQDDGTDAKIYLRSVDDISTALERAGVTPERGQTDEAYATGMDLFWNSHFTAAIPELERAVRLYDGHPNAKKYIAQAQAQAGTAADVPLPAAAPPAVEVPADGGETTGGSAGGWVLLVAGAVLAVLLLAAAVILLLLRRSRKRRDPRPGATATGFPYPSAGSPPAPGHGMPPAGPGPAWDAYGGAAPRPTSEGLVPPQVPTYQDSREPATAPVAAAAAPGGPYLQAPPVMLCPRCGAAASGGRFCSGCGQPLGG